MSFMPPLVTPGSPGLVTTPLAEAVEEVAPLPLGLPRGLEVEAPDEDPYELLLAGGCFD